MSSLYAETFPKKLFKCKHKKRPAMQSWASIRSLFPYNQPSDLGSFPYLGDL